MTWTAQLIKAPSIKNAPPFLCFPKIVFRCGHGKIKSQITILHKNGNSPNPESLQASCRDCLEQITVEYVQSGQAKDKMISFSVSFSFWHAIISPGLPLLSLSGRGQDRPWGFYLTWRIRLVLGGGGGRARGDKPINRQASAQFTPSPLYIWAVYFLGQSAEPKQRQKN